MSQPFDFMDPLIALETKIQELTDLSEQSGLDMTSEVTSLREKLDQESRALFEHLTPWQRVQLSRHPQRPQTSDYIDHMVEDFVPLAGDRNFGDDAAIICGLGRIAGHRVMVIGHQKGKDVHELRKCNFGMPHPEGYRKAMLKMRLAEKFKLPIVTFINTVGAYPGIQAEERGQSLAIAENIRDMAALRTPIVTVVIGEGGSGGALGIGVCDRMLVLENSYYSVISPEGCAAILWRDAAKASDAAEALRLTAGHLKELGIADEVVQEPSGGAHSRPDAAAEIVQAAILRNLDELEQLSQQELLDGRYEKFRQLGVFAE